MRMYFGVMLGIELKEGARLEWDAGQRFARDGAGTQLISNEEITQRIKDVLLDVTKHDDTTMWRVVDVLEGGAFEIDGDTATIIVEPSA